MRKIFTATLLLFVFQFSSQAQNNIIKTHDVNISFRELVQSIEQTSDLSFFFLDQWVEDVIIQKSYEGYTVNNALDDILTKHSISYEFLYGYAVVLLKDLRKQVIRDSVLSHTSQSIKQIKIGTSSTAGWGTIAKLSGSIHDNKFNEALVGVTILANEEAVSATSDSNGNFILNLPVGRHLLSFSSTNYSDKDIEVLLYESGKITIGLEEKPITLNEIIIEDQSVGEDFENTIGGRTRLTSKSIEKMPALLGEVDVLRSIQSLPGVTNVGEGSAGFNVRGGDAGQNLILLDNITIFNPTHLFGFFSAFHPDALRDVTFYRGAIPVQYGGRISSILDVKQKEANADEIKGSGGLGIVSSRLQVDLPLVKNKLGLMLAGRTSYSDWILDKVKNSEVNKSSASFYDFTGKLSAFIDEKNKLTGSFYSSNDKFRFANDTTYSWQNHGASLNYEGVLNEKLSISSALSIGSYQYDISDTDAHESFSWTYQIQNIQAKAMINRSSIRSKSTLGIDLAIDHFNSGKIKPLSDQSSINEFDLGTKGMRTIGVFANVERKIFSNVIIDAGLRGSLFTTANTGEEFLYSSNNPRDDNSITDTLSNTSKQYIGIEPRVSLRYSIGPHSAIKLGYSRSFQYIHLISNTAAITPIDIWVPSSRHIKPQIGDQVALGFFQKINNDQISLSAEVFYKHIDNVPEYKNGAQLILKDNIETELVNSLSIAKGIELTLKKHGRLSGNLSYTLSKTQRKTDSEFQILQVNRNQFYNANYDRPHNLKVATNYDISKRHVLSFNFTATSGRPYSIPTEKFVIDGIVVSNFPNRNSFRIPAYHRLDVSFLIRTNHKKDKPWEGSWVVTLYNLYNRKNIYSIFFESEELSTPQAYRLSILGSILPSVTYNFKF